MSHCSARSVSSGGIAYAVEYRGDWKWQREAFGLSAHWGGVNFCHICVAKGRGDPLSKSLDPYNYVRFFLNIVEYENTVLEGLISRKWCSSGGPDLEERLPGEVQTMQLFPASGMWVRRNMHMCFKANLKPNQRTKPFGLNMLCM